MSRKIHYVGLNDRAKQFVSALKTLRGGVHIKEEVFAKKIYLRKWEYPDLFKTSRKDGCVREVLQTIQCCGIFTCLELDGSKGKIKCFEWFHDPTLQLGGYDPESGGLRMSNPFNNSELDHLAIMIANNIRGFYDDPGEDVKSARKFLEDMKSICSKLNFDFEKIVQEETTENEREVVDALLKKRTSL